MATDVGRQAGRRKRETGPGLRERRRRLQAPGRTDRRRGLQRVERASPQPVSTAARAAGDRAARRRGPRTALAAGRRWRQPF